MRAMRFDLLRKTAHRHDMIAARPVRARSQNISFFSVPSVSTQSEPYALSRTKPSGGHARQFI